MSKEKNRRRRVGITPTLMSALTGDSEARLPGEVPKSIEVPVDIIPSNSVVDGKSKSKSESLFVDSNNRILSTASLYDEEKRTLSARPTVDDVSQTMKENSQQKRFNSKPAVFDEGSKMSSKSVTMSSSLKQSTNRKAEQSAKTMKSKQSSTNKKNSTVKSKTSSHHDDKKEAKSKTSSREDTFETASSFKPKVSSGKNNHGLTQLERQYLPTSLLADMHTDLIPKDQQNKLSELKKKKHEKNDIEPYQPEFDELTRLLLSDMQKDDPPTVQAALEKLGTLLKGEENVQAAYGLGAHVSLSMVMRKFSQETEIQRWGCFCFSSLARTKPLPALVIVRSGGIEALVHAMRVLPDSFSVQTNSLLALYNLLTDLEAESPEECDSRCNRFVNDLNGLQLVVQAMSRFQDKPNLQSVCCELCTSLVAKRKESVIKTAGLGKAQTAEPGARFATTNDTGFNYKNGQNQLPSLYPEQFTPPYNNLRSHQPVRPSIVLPDQERILATPQQLPQHDLNAEQQFPQQDENTTPKARRGSKYFGGKRKFFGRSTKAIAQT